MLEHLIYHCVISLLQKKNHEMQTRINNIHLLYAFENNFLLYTIKFRNPTHG